MRRLWKGVSRGDEVEGPQQLKPPAAQAGWSDRYIVSTQEMAS